MPSLLTILHVLWDLFLFIQPLKLSEVWMLVSSLLTSYLFPHQPIDDRKNVRDKTVAILAKAPQDNVITKRLISQLIQKLWDYIPKPYTVAPPEGVDAESVVIHKYRQPDGRGNSPEFPVVGMGYTRYNIQMRGRGIARQRPPASKIFTELMQRKHFRPHPNKINVFLFYLATFITHDLFWTSNTDPSINTASSYVDLQPLYGRTEEDMKKIRTFKRGLIKPDFFCDTRIPFQLPGVAVIMILFSRNHNYIARKLWALNENNRFGQLPPESLDEELFQVARNINCGCFYNIIIHDYIRTIVGVPNDSPFTIDPRIQPPPYRAVTYGNQSSLEFNYVYRWHAAIGEEDEGLLPNLAKLKQEFKGKLKIEDGLPITNSKGEWMTKDVDQAYRDEELAAEIRRGMAQIAGYPGAFNIPAILQPFEEAGIEQGRIEDLQTPTFNQYRKFYNYKPYIKFEDFNKDPNVVRALENLYNKPDDVELYPGLIAEQTREAAGGVGISEGTGFCYMIAAGILADAANLIRNDRFLTTDFNIENLTPWGYKLITDPIAVGVGAHNGSLMAHMLSHLKDQFDFSEPCVHNPYHVTA